LAITFLLFHKSLKLFETPNLVDFSTLNTLHMPGANAIKIANNYTSIFSLEEIVKK